MNSPKLLSALSGLLAVLALVSLWLLSNNQQVGDSLGIAYFVSVGEAMANPHHLLYGPIIWLLYQFANLFTEADVLAVGQVHNIAWAMVALLSLSWVVWHYTQNAFIGFFAGALLLVSHQFWQYSTQFEVYVPALGCLALLLALLIKAGMKPLTLKLQMVTVLLLFLSICYHQMGVLFLLPLGALFALQWGRVGVKAILRVAVVSGIICLLAYAVVYLTSYYPEVSLVGFMRYCVIYAYSNPDWGTFGHFTKSEEIARIFVNIEGSFLAPYWAEKLPLWLWVTGFGVLYGWNIVASWYKQIAYVLRITLLVWLAVYFLFLLWWTPGYEFFTMLTWPILLLAVFMVWDAAKWIKQQQWAAASVLLVIVGILSMANGPSFAHYHHQHDEGYNKAAEAMAFGRPECWTIVNFNVMLNLKYFHDYHRAIESDGVAVDYYYRDSVPPVSRFENMECVLVEMWYYNPWYGPMGENGFTQPLQWLQLNTNLFRFQFNEEGQLVAAAHFEVLPGSNQSPYLLVDRTQTIPVDGLHSFYARMDSLVAIHGQEKDMGYINWYEQNKTLLPGH